ncbi:ABC transporter, phosphonate, periplasmic substrate-binding protein [uncultured archaeon]|nr:ABC transporter, phosphonate, periplasmic substrate-binding protein [uncultured archaeon]
MKTVILLILTIGLIASGCVEKPEMLNLSIVQEPKMMENNTAIKVVISSEFSPAESIGCYEDMIQYISIKLRGPVKIVHRRTYQEINDLLKNGEIDLAFVGTGAYIEGNKESAVKLLAVPQAHGRTTYNSFIIVPGNSSYKNLSDLRGKKFAFTDPLSNSGRFYPEYRLSLINETSDSFFGVDENGRKNYFYTYSHENSIIAVSERLAEGAAVSSQVYEYMTDEKPEIISKTRIIEISPPFANPPVVVSEKIDPFLEQRLKVILLNMDKDEGGMKILSRITIDRFLIINDSAYDPIREMRNGIK